jgi:hypothetical protein
MHRGYTKHWRKRWEKDYCKDHLLWVMMDYFIDHANYKDTEIFFPNIGTIPLKRGEHIFSTVKLAEKLGVDRQRVRSKLKILKNIKFLTSRPTNRYTKVFVINYDTYQPQDMQVNQQTNQQLTSTQPATNQQLTIDKKVKKENKGEANGLHPLPPDFCLTEKHKKWAVKNKLNCFDLETEFEKFCEYYTGNGGLRANWDFVFYGWMRKCCKFDGELKQNSNLDDEYPLMEGGKCDA